MRGFLLPAIALVLFSPATGSAEIYQWTDKSGSIHITDNALSVPPEYRNQTRTRPDPDPPAPATRKAAGEARPAKDVPLEKREYGYVVQARVNGREACRLVVDTGATSTVLSPRIAERLGIEVRRTPPVLLHTAGGQVEAGWADLESLEVGGHKVSPLRVVFHESIEGADGLLGMNFLGAFRVEIRSDGPTLNLTRP